MVYMLVRGWFGRWKVYEVEHTEGDYTWLASFRSETLARSFMNWREIVADAD